MQAPHSAVGNLKLGVPLTWGKVAEHRSRFIPASLQRLEGSKSRRGPAFSQQNAGSAPTASNQERAILAGYFTMSSLLFTCDDFEISAVSLDGLGSCQISSVTISMITSNQIHSHRPCSMCMCMKESVRAHALDTAPRSQQPELGRASPPTNHWNR